nr:mediator of RNA polymerase II transcription subunit 14 [Tanacetum cinerariifolium]
MIVSLNEFPALTAASGVQQARALISDVPSAIKILFTGTYERLPKFTEDESSRCCYPWLSGIPYNVENIASGELGENSHIHRAGGYVLHTKLNEPGFEDNKLELPMLALVKIRLEDTPSSITWEEKHQHNGPGLEYLVSYLSGDQSFAEGDFDRLVCSYDIRSLEIIATVKLEQNSLNFPDMCAKGTHSCLLKSHFKNVTSSALDCSSMHWIVISSTIS